MILNSPPQARAYRSYALSLLHMYLIREGLLDRVRQRGFFEEGLLERVVGEGPAEKVRWRRSAGEDLTEKI